jgi:hypothetical protein
MFMYRGGGSSGSGSNESGGTTHRHIHFRLWHPHRRTSRTLRRHTRQLQELREDVTTLAIEQTEIRADQATDRQRVDYVMSQYDSLRPQLDRVEQGLYRAGGVGRIFDLTAAIVATFIGFVLAAWAFSDDSLDLPWQAVLLLVIIVAAVAFVVVGLIVGLIRHWSRTTIRRDS